MYLSTLHCFSYVYIIQVHNNYEADQAVEWLFRCHEGCQLHRETSMYTLSGNEVVDFADRHQLDISCNSECTGSAGTECLNDSDEGFTL